MARIYKHGERVRIGDYSGLNSNKTGTVITAIQAGYNNQDARRARHNERIIRLDDGNVCVVGTERLSHENPLAEPVIRGEWQIMVRVKRCKCPDGVRRSVAITGQPDTFFSTPAQVRAHGKTVTGCVTECETDGKKDYEFRPYLYCKNHVVFTEAK